VIIGDRERVSAEVRGSVPNPVVAARRREEDALEPPDSDRSIGISKRSTFRPPSSSTIFAGASCAVAQSSIENR